MKTETTTTINSRQLLTGTRPFVCDYATLEHHRALRDDLTSEDPLPAVVSGSVSAQETFITEVKQETIDEQ